MITSAAEAGRASGGAMNGVSMRHAAVDEVLPRRRAERAAEHGGEGAGAAVAEALGDPCHRLALCEASYRLGEPHLLAPLRKAHAGLALEKSRQCAGAGADAL